MKKSTTEFIIGIDSGGTKCELLITDKNKKVLFNKSYKGVHYSVSGVDDYSSKVCEFIGDSLIASKLYSENCAAICIGIAGAREDKDRANLKKAFEKKLKIKNVLITTDAMTALYGAFEGGEGIILISGTGAVLYGYSGGKLIRVGGWGRIIGDEGSGYWIGKRALNLVSKEYDNPKSVSSLLSKELKNKFGIDKDTIVEKVFGNFEIQKIAPVVIELANKKCSVCKLIMDEAVDGLMLHINTYLKVSGVKKKINIAFIGSIVENKNYLSDKLKKEIKKLKKVEVVLKKHPPVFGAVLLAGNKII